MNKYAQRKYAVLGCVMAMPVLLAAPAFAAGSGATVDASNQLDEIIVTAQKRTERLHETPLSISVLSGADIKKLGIRDFSDFATFVPGISFETAGPGQTQINIRGISVGQTVAPTVGIYIDDVPYGGTSISARIGSLALDPSAFDFERIEVLRGPQGTLYGASAMGGLIKYVTVKPDVEKYSGDASVDFSATRHGGINENVQGVVNAPVVPGKMAVRVGGYYTHDAGYIDNISGSDKANHSEVYGGKLDVLLKPSEALSVRLSAFGQNINRAGRSDANIDSVTFQPTYGPLIQNRLLAEPFNQHFRLVSGILTYDFGGPTLTSITSYQSAHSVQTQDVSQIYGPILSQFGIDFPAYYTYADTETKKFTEEVRLASAAGTKLEWLIGAFYTHEKNSDFQKAQPLNPDGSAVDGFDLLTGSLPGTYKEIAGFGDLTYHFTSRFDLTVGVRVAQNKQTFDQFASGILSSEQPPQGVSKETVGTYLINPRYKFNDHLMTYIRVASGYRPGGPNLVAIDPATNLPVAPTSFAADKLWSYEAGIKASTADNKFSFDADVFYIDWKNMQVNVVFNGVSALGNAGRAKSQGIEFTAEARPVAGLDLGANFAVTDAKLTEDALTLGGVDGERLPDSPKFSGAVRADYSFPLMGGLVGNVGGSLRYISNRKAGFDNTPGSPQYIMPSYTVTDLRAGIDYGAVRAKVYVRNLFDSYGQITALTIDGGSDQVSIIQPRTIGVNVQVSF